MENYQIYFFVLNCARMDINIKKISQNFVHAERLNIDFWIFTIMAFHANTYVHCVRI